MQQDAIPVNDSAELLQRVDPAADVVAIDETQFFDAGIIEVCSQLAAQGKRVICAGLDTDFRGKPFGPMPELLAVAERVDKLHAICMICGAPACRSQRLIDGQPADYDDPIVLIGASESYEARCRKHHQVPRRAHQEAAE